MKKFVSIYLFTFLTCCVSFSFAQDTVRVAITPKDTVFTPVLADSVSRGGAAADTTLDYLCDSLYYSAETRTILLYGTEDKPAQVEYKDMTLKAWRISFNQNSSLLYADAFVDTAGTGGNPDSVKYIGMPEFEQTGQEPLRGLRMIYNMDTEKGKVVRGKTKFSSAFFQGTDVVRVSEKTLQIKDGWYTTCDKDDHPHFHFQSPKMKFALNDKVVAKNVFLYIGGVPVMYLPFAVFPTKTGRRSGLIVPSYGSSQREGRYLRGLGYYIAPNDYMDAKMLVDFFDKQGFLFRGNLNYKLRYVLNGYASGSITRMSSGETQNRRWDLNFSHTHKIDPTMDLSVKGSFLSDKNFYKNFSLNRNSRAQRYLRSNARLNKRWEGTKNSMSVNLQHYKDLENGSVKMTLPNISFTRSAPMYPFKKSKKVTGPQRLEKKGLVPTAKKEEEEEPWYSSLNFRYNANLKSAVNKTRSDEEDPFEKEQGVGVQHNLSFSFPQKVFGYFNVSPGLTYKVNWYDRYHEKYDNNGTVESREVRKFAARRTYNGSVSINTKIFGMYAPHIAGITALRHVVTPSVSFSYQPDFSDPRFGYTSSYRDSAGVEHEYDRFEEIGSLTLGGRTPSYKSRSVSMRLDNLFQMKRMKNDKEEKFDLFNLSFNTGYNFEAKTFKWSNLNTNFHLKKFATLDVRATHSLYKYDYDQGQVVDKLLFTGGDWWKGKFLRLTNLNVTTQFKLAGGQGAGGGEGERDSARQQPQQEGEKEEVEIDEEERKEAETRFDDPTQLADFSLPWDMGLGLRYNMTKTNPLNPTKIFTGTFNMNAQLTTNWKMSASGGLDFKNKKISYIDFSFYRDLHCWELQFDWTPAGSRSGFFLIVKIKDPQLQDLKVQKRSYGGGSALGTFYNSQ